MNFSPHVKQILIWQHLNRGRQRGESVAGKNICGGRTVRAKALTPFYIMGLILCAMPCCIKLTTRLNAAPLSGIPGGETNEKGEADSPIKAARRNAPGNNDRLSYNRVLQASDNAVRGLVVGLPHIFLTDTHCPLCCFSESYLSWQLFFLAFYVIMI